MIVLGILIGFGVGMIGALLKGNKLNETRQLVKGAKEALIGFAIKNNRFPCPDTNEDGEEDCPYSPSSPYKNTKLPYITLGFRGKDPYLKQLYYDVNVALTTTSSGYDFCTALKNMAGDPQITQDGGSSYSPAAAIVLSSSENMSLDPDINSNTDNRTYETKGITDNFDDIVEWIDSTSLLAKRGCQEDCSSYTVYNNTGVDVYVQGGINGCNKITNGDMFDVSLGDTVRVYLASACTDCTCAAINLGVTYPTSQTTDLDKDCKVQSTDAVNFTLSNY